MGLFQTKPSAASSMPAYSVAANQAILIVGLGNPGEKYSGTRHNIGFSVVDKFTLDNGFPAWTAEKKQKSLTATKVLGGKRVILAKPTTFMNDSGQAVKGIQRYYKIHNSQTLVVYDELALSFGQLRSRFGGSDAGHNGIKSIIDHVGSDFGRLRIGIAPAKPSSLDAADFVLARFSKNEQASLTQIVQEALVMINEYIFSDGQLPHDTRTVIEQTI